MWQFLKYLYDTETVFLLQLPWTNGSFTLCQLFLCVQGYEFRLQHDASNEIDVNWHDSVQSSKEPVWLILQRRVYVSLQCAA